MPIEINFPDGELFDSSEQRFIIIPGGVYTFEHSLVSLSKFESKYRVPLLDRNEKTPDQLIDYISMMSLDPSFNPLLLTPETSEELINYLSVNPTATSIDQSDGSRASTYISSESIYASMAMAQVPFSAETWNLNRLMNVLAIIGERSAGSKKKKPKSEVMSEYQSLNAKRKAEAARLRGS